MPPLSQASYLAATSGIISLFHEPLIRLTVDCGKSFAATRLSKAVDYEERKKRERLQVFILAGPYNELNPTAYRRHHGKLGVDIARVLLTLDLPAASTVETITE